MTDAASAPATPPRRALSRQVLPYAMLSPAVLVTLTIVFLPMVQTAWMSLHEYVLFRPNRFVFIGLENFRTALGDEVFWISLRHTILWIGTTIPAQLLLGLVTALLLNQDFPWRPVARALIIIPWALPSVVIALMWAWIYDSNYGVANDFLLRLGLIRQAVPWLADRLSCARHAPCWSVLLTLDRAGPDLARAPTGVSPLAAIMPGRTVAGAPSRLVLHANPAWSLEHLEVDPRAVIEALVAPALEGLGLPRAAIVEAVAHRWRYARVARAVGVDALHDPSALAVVVGDGIRGEGVESAFLSGLAGAGHLARLAARGEGVALGSASAA